MICLNSSLRWVSVQPASQGRCNNTISQSFHGQWEGVFTFVGNVWIASIFVECNPCGTNSLILFRLTVDQLSCLVHRQSVVHILTSQFCNEWGMCEHRFLKLTPDYSENYHSYLRYDLFFSCYKYKGFTYIYVNIDFILTLNYWDIVTHCSIVLICKLEI